VIESKETTKMNAPANLSRGLGAVPRSGRLLALAAITLLAAFCGTAAAAEVEAPGMTISSVSTPTNFVPGDTANPYTYEVRIDNLGGAPTDGSPITITDTLPAGLTVERTELNVRYAGGEVGGSIDLGTTSLCETDPGASVTVKCTLPTEFPTPEFADTDDEPSVLFPGEELLMTIYVSPETASEGEALVNHAVVEGGGVPVVSATSENEASATPAPVGFEVFNASVTGADGQPVTQAGSHPYAYTTSYSVNTRRKPEGADGPEIVAAGGDTKEIRVKLPPGLVGNPTSTPRCTLQQFNTLHLYQPFPQATSIQLQANECPDASMIGYVILQRGEGTSVNAIPIFNLVPPPGQPAQLGLHILQIPIFLDASVRSGGDYGVDATLSNLSEAKQILSASVTLWGTPGDPRHDDVRGRCLNEVAASFPNNAIGLCPTGETPVPFWRLPSECTASMSQTMRMSTWTDSLFEGTSPGSPASGCSSVEFEPGLQARPSTDVADSPTGLHVDVHVPQNQDYEGLGTADLEDTVLTLPKGMAVNPASANGLGTCSEAQAGVTSDPGVRPITFTPDAAQCPAAARIGSVEVDTPLVDHPLPGGVYVATPHANPFGSLLALYIAVADPETGVVIKLPGEVHADPQTGQLTTVFSETPQQPFDDFKVDLFGGPLAALRTPAVCQTYTSTSRMTPYSAPESGPPATPSDSYAISKAPGGGSCATSEGARPNAPAFSAGTEAPIARAYSPFIVRLHREDGSQEFSSVTVTPPPGLLGKLAGIPYCPDADLAAAEAKSGRQELAAPSCPAGSQVGTVNVAAGAGPAPYNTQGRAYLTGPYKGAPLGLAVITPAAAGPYDLGTVVSRVALRVNPETAQITANSDPIPHILQGIPLDVRTIEVKLDRPDFTLNPTNCDPLAFSGLETSTLGQGASLAQRFQVAECGALKFAPKLSLRLKGKTNRGAHPSLRAVLTMPAGGANIAHAAVALPHSEFIDQGHFQTICTRVQFAAKQCPAGSVYGFARAYSPLLEQPLEGPVYLRSSSHKLPDLVAALDGQIHVDVVGRVDSVRGGIRSTFESVPDAPVTRFVLTMQGGNKGLFVNSTNICKGTHRAVAEFDGQNGKIADSKPPLRAQCGKRRKGGKSHKGQHRAASRAVR
jgi:hypothetical protein